MAGTNDNIVMGDKEDDFSEAICAICDNGGDVICCEGECLRAFHATVEAGSDAACASLGFSKKQIKEIETFRCANCKYNQHPCYICGKLGSSDKSAGAEVFQCGNRTCGYFYHPSCIANDQQLKNEDEPKDIEAEIASGKTFKCPLHYCYACKEPESEYEADLPMQFAVCRRCPRAYHRKCLPGTIAFQADVDKGIQQRGWDELIPNKVLIYCMEHDIDDELLTPLRSHIIFPHSDLKKVDKTLESDPEVEVVVPRKRLHKKKTVSRRNSGPYSLRDTKLLKKRKLLKKNRKSSKKALDELKREANSNTLEKKSSSRKGLNGPLNNENSDAIKLEAENETDTSKKCIGNEHGEPVDKSMNSRDMHNSGTPSRKGGYMALGFAPGPCCPFSEYSSAGWLDE